MKNEKPCEVNPLFIEQFADNELGYAESAEIAGHLKGCSACRRRFDAVRSLKDRLRAVSDGERLSPLERAGLEKLIENSTPERSLLKTLPAFLFSGGRPLITAASIAVGVLVTVFFYQMVTIERQGEQMIGEILSLHDHSLPDEFGAEKDIEALIGRNLKMAPPKLARLVADRAIQKARFTHIGAHPAASIRLTDGADSGTILLTRHNDDLHRLFSDSPCADGVAPCRTRRRTMNGRDLLFWRERDGDYLFVSDNGRMTNGMARRISAE